MIKPLSLTLCLLLLPEMCLAGPEELSAIKKLLPGSSVLDASTGLIGEQNHLAAVVLNKAQDSIAIAVFAHDKDNRYRLDTISQWMDRHGRWYETSVKIKNSSLYFTLRGNGGCCFDYTDRYQFKQLDGKLRLIGKESSETGIDARQDKSEAAIDGGYISYRYGTSINYLTNRVSHWRVQAPSTSAEPMKDDITHVKSGLQRKENNFKFSPLKDIYLEDFDVFAEIDAQDPHLSGYFDQDFKYRE